MLLVFATSYDAVTKRTITVARSLLEKTQALNIETVQLLNERATRESLREALCKQYKVVAFYSHGDADGSILAQDASVCIEISDHQESLSLTFYNATLYAHACRAFLWFSKNMSLLNLGKILGYSEDLMIPNTDNGLFWELYENIHSYIPLQFIRESNLREIREGFYRLCSEAFVALEINEASLVELMSIMQARDSLEVNERHIIPVYGSSGKVT